ncbi:MATE family efflux transporter [Oceanicaulis sp. LC35]|uniref:MATE family efflux transporter n=1 Tax=Oceanicaulis sp. LC35 TaxID=3349635 RepID=UPI003F867F47
MTAFSLTRKQVFLRALPIMGANIASPLVGLVDLAVIGRTADTNAIAAVALGGLVFNVFFWSVAFLRMGATALTAQADGRADEGELRAVLWRAGAIGAAIGIALLLFQTPLKAAVFALFDSPADVEGLGREYVNARLWGAPAAFAGFAVYGWLIGLGLTGRALILQAVLNVLNAGLSVLFVLGLDMGVAGVGAASAASQWLHLLAAAVIILLILRQRGPAPGSAFWDKAAIRRLFSVNRDIFLRTLALLAGFTWFNIASLREGADVLAGNAILMQYISICAFFLDAFAHVTEAETGRAAGAKNWNRLMRAFRLTSELALGFSLILSLGFFMLGDTFIGLMTTDEATRLSARSFLVWCALVPLLGMPSWQLDGLMIGATRGPLMRNAMIAALLIYLALDAALRPLWGAHGLWLAFLLYYVARAGTLMVGWPGLKRSFET